MERVCVWNELFERWIDGERKRKKKKKYLEDFMVSNDNEAAEASNK